MVAKLLISSNGDALAGKVGEMLKNASLKNPHPDLFYFSKDAKLGIEEARKIKDFFSLKPYQAKGKAVVLEDALNLTPEAQNALLKTLEELPKDALFILCAKSDATLLPTVLSRCQVERLQVTGDRGQFSDYTEKIEGLLKSNIEERFEYIEKLKDREEFFHSLIGFFHQKLPSNAEFVEELLQAEVWQKQNVNIRAVLEYLMLVMPQKSW